MSNGGPPITDDTPRLRVVRIHINDWVASTRGMSLDEEGFFWRFTCLFYDRMGDLPDDDRIVSRAMNLDIRSYKHMKARMVALGKIAASGGRLSNARAEREISAYVAEYKRRSDAARQREEAKRQTALDLQTTPKIDTDIEPKSVSMLDRSRVEVASKSVELRSETDDDLFEKDNKNKDQDTTTLAQGDHSPRARARPKPKPKPLSEEEDICAVGTARGDVVGAFFERFWQAFPATRKRGKGHARDKFAKIVAQKLATPEQIVSAVESGCGIDPNFPPMPMTWLNQGRWEDDPARAAMDPEPRDGKVWGWWRGKEQLLAGLPVERWRKAVVDAKPNGTWPWWILGAPPGHAECLVPKPIVDEFGYEAIYRGSITHA